MKKFFIAVLTFLSVANFAMSQSAELLLSNGGNGPYLTHKVVPKESFFSIGRLYNVHPKTIAAFNKLDITKGLVIGQSMNIPLTDTNFIQKGNSGTPVYYKVGEKEGLMKVSNASNDVSLANLRQWNKLTNDNLKAGSKLIVGFLQSKEMTSVTIPANNTTKNEQETKVEEKAIAEKPKVVEEKKPVTETPKTVEEKKPVAEVVKTVEEKKPEVKEEPKKTEPVFTRQENGAGTGFFKYHFEQQIKSRPVSKDAAVTSGVFKTTSGWMDAKYYLLMDGVQPGVIVRITNPTNSKIIFAKVLGEMTGIRQNEGLNIRISSAAASVLQVTDQDKFIVKVNY